MKRNAPLSICRQKKCTSESLWLLGRIAVEWGAFPENGRLRTEIG